MSKTKGITIWEQYAEHIFIGLTVLALLVFTVLQLNPGRNAVEVTGERIQPGDVDRRLAEEAERIRIHLADDAAPRVEFDEPQRLSGRFAQRLGGPVSPAPSLGSLFAHVPLDTGEEIRPDAVFPQPDAPSPTRLATRQYFDALPSSVVESYEQLQARFESEPYDKSWITVAGVIDLQSVLDQFRAKGMTEEISPIPPSWYMDRATVVDLRIEREERVNGGWTNHTVLEPLPGQTSYREIIADSVDASQRDAILRQLHRRGGQEQVIQPEFYPTRNATWVPPDPFEDEVIDETLTPEEREIQSLQRELTNLIRRRDQIRQQIGDVGGPGQPRGGPGGAAPPGGGDGGGLGGPGGAAPPGGGGGGGGLGGPGGASPPGGAGGGPDRPRDGHIERLQRQLERLEDIIDERRARLEELEASTDVEDDADSLRELVVWGHDMDIEPGRVYRYRMVVDVYNPFFARGLNLTEQQERLADSFTITSEASDWSEPIQVRPPLHTFVTRAYAPGHDRRAGGSASSLGYIVADVYRFYDGRWWRSTFNVVPGERIGRPRDEGRRDEAQVTIDYATEWYVLDIIEDPDRAGQAREGRAAHVVLQNVIDGRTIEFRHPVEDRESTMRARLEEELRLAEGHARRE